MTHAEIIVDKDPCFEIDTITREIKNMTTGKTSLMQYDHNSERFGFTMPRFVEGHDMLNCDRVEVHYLNTDGMTQQQAKGLYLVEDVALSEESEETLTFSWLLSQNATKYVGTLTFLIRFICLEGDAKLAYAWHTSIFTGISVAKGMNNSDEIAEEYADIVNQWYTACKPELVVDVFNALKGMNAFDIVSFTSNTKVTLTPGRIYFFESTGDTYKVQLYDQDGKVQSKIDKSTGGIILYPSSGLAKYMSIKEKPSSIGLSDLLNFKGLFDKFIQTTTFNVNTEKPNIYIESVDNHDFWCWEITGNSCDLQIGTYAMKELIEGITAELSVSFIYPLEFDEYAVAIDDVEIERQSYGGTMRIAAELLKAKNTQIVFYRNDEEVIRARVHPTILNCGMLYAVER